MNKIKEQEHQYIAPTYARFDVAFVRGDGATLYDDTGKAYTDMGSGIAVNVLGYGNELWEKAVCDQAGKLAHISNLYYTQPQALLAENLCKRSGLSRAFFGNSGAEANECAIKAARKYAQDKKGQEYHTIVTLINSFHGRTLTTLAATGQEHYHEQFTPLTPGFVYAAANMGLVTTPVLPAALLAHLPRKHVSDIPALYIGYFWNVMNFAGKAYVLHAGRSGGYFALVLMSPADLSAVVFLSDTEGDFTKESWRLLELVTGKSIKS